MSRLETIESLISQIPCPVCLNSRLEVQMHCETPRAPCDFHAICGHCGHKFAVTEDAKTMEDVWLKVKEHMAGKGCPECGDTRLNLEFLCEVGSEDCFFLVRCGNGHASRVNNQGLISLFT